MASNNGDVAAGVALAPAAGNPDSEGGRPSDPVDVIIDKLLRLELP